jgi:hypothetical protein
MTEYEYQTDVVLAGTISARRDEIRALRSIDLEFLGADRLNGVTDSEKSDLTDTRFVIGAIKDAYAELEEPLSQRVLWMPREGDRGYLRISAGAGSEGIYEISGYNYERSVSLFGRFKGWLELSDTISVKSEKFNLGLSRSLSSVRRPARVLAETNARPIASVDEVVVALDALNLAVKYTKFKNKDGLATALAG